MQKKMIHPGETVMDIGANFGWYAMNIAKYFPESNVLSFEPIPDTYKFLSANIQLNNIRNIEIFNFGFSDKAGTENLYFDPKLSVNASLANLSDSENAVKVACHFDTLDHFVFSKGLHVDFIKCDVEGAELLVFKGGREVIARDKPVVFSEMLRKWSAKFDYHPNEIIELFDSLGYSCYTIVNEVLSSCSHVDESTVETNFFFLHDTEHKNILNDPGIVGNR
jgi:FkbM family methyltransferase